jgi:hypothetical protein
MNKDNQKLEYDVKSASERLEELNKLSPRDIEAQNNNPRTKNEQIAKNNKVQIKPKARPKRQSIDNKKLDESYTKIITRVQSELPASNRLFSKIIHYKPVETLSEFIGSTIARPNSILFGAIFAFISTLILYIMAKTIGYTLSGSEPILAFCVGWVAGLLYDFLHLLFVGNKTE